MQWKYSFCAWKRKGIKEQFCLDFTQDVNALSTQRLEDPETHSVKLSTNSHASLQLCSSGCWHQPKVFPELNKPGSPSSLPTWGLLTLGIDPPLQGHKLHPGAVSPDVGRGVHSATQSPRYLCLRTGEQKQWWRHHHLWAVEGDPWDYQTDPKSFRKRGTSVHILALSLEQVF